MLCFRFQLASLSAFWGIVVACAGLIGIPVINMQCQSPFTSAVICPKAVNVVLVADVLSKQSGGLQWCPTGDYFGALAHSSLAMCLSVAVCVLFLLDLQRPLPNWKPVTRAFTAANARAAT